MHDRPAKAPTAKPPLLQRDFLWLMLAHLLQAVGWSSALLLPLFIDTLGASRSEIGLVMASGAIGGLLARPSVGSALDRWGRHQTITLGTLIVVAAMIGLLGVDAVGWPLVLLRMLFGAGTGALFTGYFTLATDLIPASRRTEGIALFGITGLVPLIINPIAGAVGVQGQSIPPFLALMSLTLLASLWPLWRAKAPRAAEAATTTPTVSFAALVLEAKLRSAWIGTLIFASCVMLFMTFAMVVATKRGLTDPAHFWWTYAGGAVMIRLFGAQVPDRLGPHNLLLPALSMSLLGLVVLAGVSSQTDLLLAGLLGGLGHGMGFPVLTSQIASRSEPAVRGRAMATFTGLWDVCSLCSPPAMGMVADRYGDAPMLSGVALAATVGMVLWALAEHRSSS